jgi:threonine/homoserine/homoserine lactone efflux protein
MVLRNILRGVLLGIGAAAPVGPVNVEIARRALKRGFRAGFALGCGAVTVDVTYAVLASLSLGPAMRNVWALRIVGLCGAAILAWLGIASLRSAARVEPIRASEPPPAPQDHRHRDYPTGLLMTAVNPMTLVFWFAVVPGTIAEASEHPVRDLLLVCAGVFLATIGWVIGFAGTLAALGSFGKQKWVRVVDAAGGVILLAFAALAIWRVARSFLS